MASLSSRALHALGLSAAMGWQMLWPLILGFTISAAVQAVVSKKELGKLLPDDSPGSLVKASALGAASSSCSYAATALARSLFRKGAHFTAAIAFEIASTNLVLELGIVLVVVMGWTFMIAEFVGGALMIALVALLFRLFLSEPLQSEAKAHAERGVAGKMEGHASMHMAVTEGPLFRRLFSAKGRTAISHYFVMDWVSVWKDIAVGLLISGAVAVFVPDRVWAALFLKDQPLAAKLVGPLVGPLVAIFTFVCSVGNVPLAAVLWSKGSSFGGVVAFLFADLIVLPILNIYRKYYGLKVSVFLLASLYAAMAGAAFVLEGAFALLGLAPERGVAQQAEPSFSWDYTTFLNLGFLALAALLLVRFFRTGGPRMLAKMNAPQAHPEQGARETGSRMPS